MSEGDTGIKIIQSTTEDHYVLIQFAMARNGQLVFDLAGNVQGRMVDHVKLTPEEALNMAQGLVEDAKAAAAGRVIMVPRGFNG